jgi:hypothetical protein
MGVKLKIAAGIMLIAMILGILTALRLNRETETAVNERMDGISQSAVREEQKIFEHKTQAVERVTVIREQVRSEVEELDADGLAEFALNEIGIYKSEYVL